METNETLTLEQRKSRQM